MLVLAEKLGISAKLLDKLKCLDSVRINSLSDKCISKGFHFLKRENDVVRLAVILTLAVRVRDKYKEAGIDGKIYYDTMSDIRIWCERNGNKGLHNYGWLKNHVSFELFRLGRLQFQLYECKNRTLIYSKLPFEYGEKLIYIHIPEGEKLETEKCRASLSQANEFFRFYFPSFAYDFYFCESWLLYENNRDFMSTDSNIVAFMSMFDICYSIKIDAQAIERIYGKRHLLKRNYPEKTDLQKRAKAYIRYGKSLGIGVGVIKK